MRWFLLVSLSFLATSAQADPGRRVMRLERTLMSPFCPGKTLHACPSPRASEWRSDIGEWVETGVSDRVIVERLQSRVPGFDLHARPSGNADWGIPLGAAAFATLVLVWVARRWRPDSVTSDHTETHARTEPDAYDAILDDELSRFEA